MNQDPTPLKQAGEDIKLDSHLATKVVELVEQRNGTMKMLNAAEEDGELVDLFSGNLIEERTYQFEDLLVELGNIVGVECLRSVGR